MKFYDKNYLYIVDDIINNEIITKLKNFKHHYGSNRLQHSISVSYYSYLVCKFLHLDYISIARAGLLHDLFLYDCENKKTRPKFHIWKHPKIALQNAKKFFDLNNKECDIILKHMWPITLSIPKYPESFVISFIDKYCAFIEWNNYLINKFIYYFFIYFSTYKQLDFII